jgi:hypothetical protein
MRMYLGMKLLGKNEDGFVRRNEAKTNPKLAPEAWFYAETNPKSAGDSRRYTGHGLECRAAREVVKPCRYTTGLLYGLNKLSFGDVS